MEWQPKREGDSSLPGIKLSNPKSWSGLGCRLEDEWKNPLAFGNSSSDIAFENRSDGWNKAEVGQCVLRALWSELAEFTPLSFSFSLKILQLKRRWSMGDATDCRSTRSTKAQTRPHHQSSGQVQDQATYMGARGGLRPHEKVKKTRIKQAMDFGIEVGASLIAMVLAIWPGILKLLIKHEVHP